MKIRTLSSKGKANEFDALHWDLAFVGHPVDTRGQEATNFARAHSTKTFTCSYDLQNSCQIFLDGTRTVPNDIVQKFRNANRVLLEATTLDVVELVALLRATKKINLPKIDLLYTEPNAYQKEVSVDAPWTREFSLSSSRRFEGVPGFTSDLSAISRNSQLIAFLGYEGARLAQACEQLENLAPLNKFAVFGVPGYSPGWEINAIANNVTTIDTKKWSAKYSGASSVSCAFRLLEELHQPRKLDEGRTIVAPLGTKPHSIATALFVVENCSYQETSLIYDHPTRSPGRSSDVRRWHLYQIVF